MIDDTTESNSAECGTGITNDPFPEITEEEDKPFPPSKSRLASYSSSQQPDQNLGDTDKLARERFRTGRLVLLFSMGMMVILVVADALIGAFFESDRSLISSAFDAFKLIAMTVLGYVFASNHERAN